MTPEGEPEVTEAEQARYRAEFERLRRSNLLPFERPYFMRDILTLDDVLLSVGTHAGGDRSTLRP